MPGAEPAEDLPRTASKDLTRAGSSGLSAVPRSPVKALKSRPSTELKGRTSAELSSHHRHAGAGLFPALRRSWLFDHAQVTSECLVPLCTVTGNMCFVQLPSLLLQVSAVQEGARKGEEGRCRWQVHLGQHDDRPGASRPARGQPQSKMKLRLGYSAMQLLSCTPHSLPACSRLTSYHCCCYKARAQYQGWGRHHFALCMRQLHTSHSS